MGDAGGGGPGGPKGAWGLGGPGEVLGKRMDSTAPHSYPQLRGVWYGFRMDFPWMSYCFPMAFLWISYGFRSPLDFLRIPPRRRPAGEVGAHHPCSTSVAACFKHG